MNSDNRLDWVTAWRQRLIRERAKHREAIVAIDQRLSNIDSHEAALRRSLNGWAENFFEGVD